MPDENQETSAEVTEEPKGPPVPEVTAESQPPISDQVGKDVAAILKRLDDLEGTATPEFIRQEAHRAVKSLSDSRLAKVDEIVRWVEESGGDVSKIKPELEISDLRARLAALEGGPTYQASPGETSTDEMRAAMEADSALILQEAGISFEDPEYVALVETYKASGRIVSRSVWKSVVETFVELRKKRTASSPASAVVEGGGPAATRTTEDALEAEYQERLDKLPQGATREIANLKAEFRKKGLVKW